MGMDDECDDHRCYLIYSIYHTIFIYLLIPSFLRILSGAKGRDLKDSF